MRSTVQSLHTSSTTGKRLFALLSAVLMLLGLGAATSQAAAASPIVRPVSVHVSIPMHVTGFNAAVARAHGYSIKTLANGKQYSIKDGAEAVSPNDVIGGNCGSAFMYYNAVGSKDANVFTGFDVDESAWQYDWAVAVTDDAGVGNHDWDGYLASRNTWAVNWMTDHSVTGYSTAIVTSGSALLDNGDVCAAGPASDYTYLY